jgi:hypothetical protein
MDIPIPTAANGRQKQSIGFRVQPLVPEHGAHGHQKNRQNQMPKYILAERTLLIQKNSTLNIHC